MKHRLTYSKPFSKVFNMDIKDKTDLIKSRLRKTEAVHRYIYGSKFLIHTKWSDGSKAVAALSA